MKKLFRIASLSALVASCSVPLLALAQTGIDPTRLGEYTTGIEDVINDFLVPLLMALAFIVFLWGVYKYFILGAADEKSREDGRKFTLWGIIGFVVILSLWAFVNLIRGTFGLDNDATAPPPPTIWGTSRTTGSNTRASSGSNTRRTQSRGSQTQYGSNGQPYVWGTSQDTAYNNMQSTCSQSGSSSAECQNAQSTYLQTYNPAYAPTGSCPAGCSPGSMNPNQCVDAGGAPCGGGGSAFSPSNIDPSNAADNGGTSYNNYDGVPVDTSNNNYDGVPADTGATDTSGGYGDTGGI